MSGNQIVVYGSYGYTGKLIVEEGKKRGLDIMLAGRNGEALSQQSKDTGFPFSIVEIHETEKLEKLLAPAQLVIHCGGPFLFTAKRMVNACLATKTHYIDITGEIAVFEMLHKFDQAAQNASIMLLPGAGFDVVPSDCLALHTKERLPDATHLQLAFAMSGGGSSRGTAKTAVLGLGEGSRIRKDGKIVAVPLHEGLKKIDFGDFQTISARIPWGDVSTAFYSTGIPNISVYMGINNKIATFIKSTRWLNWLLKRRWLKGFLLKKIDKTTGPASETRNSSKSLLTCKVWNDEKLVESRMVAPNGYALTAISSITIAENTLSGNFKIGFQTPSLAYGSSFIQKIPGVTITDL